MTSPPSRCWTAPTHDLKLTNKDTLLNCQQEPISFANLERSLLRVLPFFVDRDHRGCHSAGYGRPGAGGWSCDGPRKNAKGAAGSGAAVRQRVGSTDNWVENDRIISVLSHGDWILAEIEQTSAWIVIFSIRRDRE